MLHCDFKTNRAGQLLCWWLELRIKSSSGAQWTNLGLFHNSTAFKANETQNVGTPPHAPAFHSVPVTTILMSVILHTSNYWPYDLVCVYICMFSRNLMSSTPFCIYVLINKAFLKAFQNVQSLCLKLKQTFLFASSIALLNRSLTNNKTHVF